VQRSECVDERPPDLPLNGVIGVAEPSVAVEAGRSGLGYASPVHKLHDEARMPEYLAGVVDGNNGGYRRAGSSGGVEDAAFARGIAVEHDPAVVGRLEDETPTSRRR
jgi:hypothetical protein